MSAKTKRDKASSPRKPKAVKKDTPDEKGEPEQSIPRAIIITFDDEGNWNVSQQRLSRFELPTLLRLVANKTEKDLTATGE